VSSSSVETVRAAGNDMQLHTAKPDEAGQKPAIIVIQEIFGVDDHIEDVALRFAAAGYFAVAPELFHRGGAGTVIPYAETERAFGERDKLSNDDIVADLQATVDYLKSNPDVDSDNIGIVGFCFGGFVSYYSAATVSAIKAAAVFYGGGVLPRPGSPADAPRVLDLTADQVDAPMIGFWGDQDGGIPLENVAAIESTLKSKGKDYESHTYEGAGHGFFCNDRASYNAAAANDSWSRTIDFFGKHLK
jgi:carboxymethylenebutenolidase